MKEEWRAVIGYEGLYEVSNLGRVRGLDRITKRCECGRPLKKQKGRLLKWIIHKFGYPMISLSRGNKYRQRMVHRLVLEAFIGPCPSGMEGCHKNGQRADPRLDNLRWDTKKANHADKWAHGTMLVGEQTNSAKLTESAVKAIRASKERVRDLMRRYGVGRNTIIRVRRGETWRHVSMEAA